jgi:hypothetical protein
LSADRSQGGGSGTRCPATGVVAPAAMSPRGPSARRALVSACAFGLRRCRGTFYSGMSLPAATWRGAAAAVAEIAAIGLGGREVSSEQKHMCASACMRAHHGDMHVSEHRRALASVHRESAAAPSWACAPAHSSQGDAVPSHTATCIAMGQRCLPPSLDAVAAWLMDDGRIHI